MTNQPRRRWFRFAFTARTRFTYCTIMFVASNMTGCSNDRPINSQPVQVRRANSLPVTKSDAKSFIAEVITEHKIDVSDAKSIIAEFIAEQKIDVSDFEPPTIMQDGPEWEFFYQEKPPRMPGGDFSIRIDAAGTPSLIGGE